MASTRGGSGTMDYWDWLPGIMLIDETTKYTLPAEELSAYAGTEAADNDPREFHGLFDGKVYEKLVLNFLHAANQITGPGWANWPFGHRQLEHAVMCWIKPRTTLPDVLLLMSTRQKGPNLVIAGLICMTPVTNWEHGSKNLQLGTVGKLCVFFTKLHYLQTMGCQNYL